MCSISVEPRPSRMSTPKRFFHSSADVLGQSLRRPRRTAQPLRAVLRRAGRDRPASWRRASAAPKNDRRLLAPQHVEDRLPASGGRAAAPSVAPTDMRKAHAVAEPVGVIELAGREARRRPRGCRARPARRVSRSPSGSHARAARPSACRSSRTSRARTRPRRRRSSAGCAGAFGAASSVSKRGARADGVADHDQVFSVEIPAIAACCAACSNGAETNSAFARESSRM